MKIRPEAVDFNFEYTGSQYSANDAAENGFKQLTGEELQDRIVNKTFYGDYPMGYKFIADIYANGKTEGVNNIGTYDIGHWVIDRENHTMSIKWENGWMDSVTRAYDVNGSIEFYDFATGQWRTTFKKSIAW
jgi:hypothetical protein